MADLDTERKESKEEPANFETAISSTGFGLFNLILFLISVPSCFATVFETTTMSYVLPKAECDLNLTLLDKGILNAVTYAGMISSAIFWGYLADTRGRQKLLVIGFGLDAIFVSCGSFSRSIEMLMVFKFLGGFAINGPFAVLMSYLTEFHGNKHRSRVLMVLGCLFSTATLLLPCIAWTILPQKWILSFFNGLIVMKSWQVFIAVCALPSLISSIAISFLPESPKFLMSQGRNEEALEVFKKVFSINMHQPRDSYPITELIEEIAQKPTIFSIEENKANGGKAIEKPTFIQGLRSGLRQLRPMFSKPILGHSLHVYSLQFFILLGLNTIRLWLPQLFTSIANFEEHHLNSTESANVCDMIHFTPNRSIEETESDFQNIDKCNVDIPITMYINSIIVGVAGLMGYFVAGTLINALGKKWMLVIGLSISSICGFVMYYTSSSLTTLIISSIYVTVGSISATSLMGVVVDLFPTSVRTMILSLSMMFGRLGALIGNILFPYFMSLGCLPPFLMVGGVMLTGALLGSLLSISKKNDLK